MKVTLFQALNSPLHNRDINLVRSNKAMLPFFFIFSVNEGRKPFAYLARRSKSCSDDKARQEFEEVSFTDSTNIRRSKNQAF